MPTKETAVAEWKRLYVQWHDAHMLAKAAREAVRQLSLGVAAGGPGPTNDEIWETVELETRADMFRLEMDGFVLGFMS